MRVEDP
jgi:hypothetical protein